MERDAGVKGNNNPSSARLVNSIAALGAKLNETGAEKLASAWEAVRRDLRFELVGRSDALHWGAFPGIVRQLRGCWQGPPRPLRPEFGSPSVQGTTRSNRARPVQ